PDTHISSESPLSEAERLDILRRCDAGDVAEILQKLRMVPQRLEEIIHGAAGKAFRDMLYSTHYLKGRDFQKNGDGAQP
ncbi:MAG: hypothetical protein KGH66_03580, partial [Candidatus Micrarchaeota archaeon]|nr:hypothetical protein [Candidatus Micrarchaeota archaeon]